MSSTKKTSPETTLDPLATLLVNPKPWFTTKAIDFLEKNVRSDDRVLEFGGGVSSLWWADKTAYTYTVEADAKWGSRLLQEMHARPELLAKWSLLLAPCEWHTHPSNPKTYWKRHKAQLTPDNVAQLEKTYLWTNLPFDPTIVVIDGSVRPQSCRITDQIADSLGIRMIVVDNTEVMMRHTEGCFANYERYDFAEQNKKLIPAHQNGQWMTSVFVRRIDFADKPTARDTRTITSTFSSQSIAINDTISQNDIVTLANKVIDDRSADYNNTLQAINAKVRLREKRIKTLASTNFSPVLDVDQITAEACPVCNNMKSVYFPYPDAEDNEFSRCYVVGCTNCGLSRLVGQPIDLAAYYRSKYAENVQKSRSSSPGVYFADKSMSPVLVERGERVRNIIASLLPNTKSVLDFGAGTGVTLNALSAIERRVAVEIDPNCLPFLQHIGVSVAPSLNQLNEKFDVVIATHVLEHIYAADVRGIAKQLVSKTNPGGLLILEVPGASLLTHLVSEKHAPHTLFFSPESLEKLFGGLDVEQIELSSPARVQYPGRDDRHYQIPKEHLSLTGVSPLVLVLQRGSGSSDAALEEG
ncbi:class I SAM-dependent methyltransferase [Roseibium algae]|uniref:Class I SAM-dependent methyltransferase n=1 Tax=Roseibium algae TaxID=3123038 RepID=A0ABU8TS54_9HYPH